jgi:hypothetical protein
LNLACPEPPGFSKPIHRIAPRPDFKKASDSADRRGSKIFPDFISFWIYLAGQIIIFKNEKYLTSNLNMLNISGINSFLNRGT